MISKEDFVNIFKRKRSAPDEQALEFKNRLDVLAPALKNALKVDAYKSLVKDGAALCNKLAKKKKFGDALVELGKLEALVKRALTTDDWAAPTDTEVTFLSMYTPRKDQVDEVLGLDDRIPPALLLLKAALVTANDQVQDAASGGDHATAVARMPNLVTKLEAALDPARKLLADRARYEEEYGKIRAKVETFLDFADEFPPSLTPVYTTFTQAQAALAAKADPPAYDFTGALPLIDPLAQSLDDRLATHEEDRKQFAIEYAKVEQRIKAIVALNDLIPASLKESRDKIKDVNTEAVRLRDAKEFTQARAKLGEIIPPRSLAVDGATAARMLHVSAMRKYYKTLKKLDRDIKYYKGIDYGAASEAVQKAIDKAEEARAAVITEQDAREYAKACEKLALYRTAIDKIIEVRLTEMKAQVEGADTPNKVHTVVTALQPCEIANLSPDAQVDLLKTLRTKQPLLCAKSSCKAPWPNADGSGVCGTCGHGSAVTQRVSQDDTPEAYEARCKLYDNIPMQPEFVAKDKEFRSKVVEIFTTDKKFKEARDNWSTLTQNERFEFLSYAAEKQCGVMGQPKPDVLVDTTLSPRTCEQVWWTCTTVTYECKNDLCGAKGSTWTGGSTATHVYKQKCETCNEPGDEKSKCTSHGNKYYYFPTKSHKCPDCGEGSYTSATACDTAWPTDDGKGNCSNGACNGVDTGTAVSFGGCNLALIGGADKSKISLNGSNNVIGNFKEAFDTIMHENAHNYQLYLIKRYREDKDKLFKEIPYAAEIEPQIKLWDENAGDPPGSGYVPGGPSYDNQPLEEHAWQFGGKVSAKTLGLKPAKPIPGDIPADVADIA